MFKIHVGKPSLRDLVEIQMDSRFNLYPVPFGDLNKVATGETYVVKRSVPWKGLKGEQYKKYKDSKGEILYKKQQEKAGKVREAAHEANDGKPIEGVVLVEMTDGTYKVMPAVAAAYSANYVNKARKKPRYAKLIGTFASKDAAINYAIANGLIGKRVAPTQIATPKVLTA